MCRYSSICKKIKKFSDKLRTIWPAKLKSGPKPKSAAIHTILAFMIYLKSINIGQSLPFQSVKPSGFCMCLSPFASLAIWPSIGKILSKDRSLKLFSSGSLCSLFTSMSLNSIFSCSKIQAALLLRREKTLKSLLIGNS